MPEFKHYPNIGITVAYVFGDDVEYWVDWVNGTGAVVTWKDGNSIWSSSRVF